MSLVVEHLTFDTRLFGFSVGRLEVCDSDLPCGRIAIQEALRQSYGTGTKLVYLISSSDEDNGLPGSFVDAKTTYSINLDSLDASTLSSDIYSHDQIRIRVQSKDLKNNSHVLRSLALASGEWSRFRVDSKISNSVFEAMYDAWINNSVNRSIADEIFVAVNASTGADVGLITLKLRDNVVSIGLLAVDSSCRRQGIAKLLLSRAVLWALERIEQSDSHRVMSVVTQGANKVACSCYERFGFSVAAVQRVYHVWLPEHLVEPRLVCDQAPLAFCKQHFTGKELDCVAQVLQVGLDSGSRYTVMCAAKIQEILGEDSERVIMVPSGTAALEMAALLLNLTAGDEVIMPSYTFASTANAVVLRGAVPVFVDIRLDTLNIDEQLIEGAITSRTRAICCVHYAGIPCEMDTICDIARRHGLAVVEDAAQGFLSTYKGRQLGTIGDFGCFSFHYTKNVIAGEGGAISINRSPLAAERVRRALVLWEKGTNRYDFMSGKVDKYEWVDIGSSYIPSEVTCAVLWAQLTDCHLITAARLENFRTYSAAFTRSNINKNTSTPSTAVATATDGRIHTAVIPSDCSNNGHIFYLVFDSVAQRQRVQAALKLHGVTAFSHYVPLHSSPAGVKFGRVGAGSTDMTVTDRVFRGLLRLPLWYGLTPEQLQDIIDVIEQALSV